MLTLWASGQERAWLNSFRMRTPFQPRYCEIDTYGHVSVVMYDAYLEQGRMEYFAAIGDPSSGDPFPFATRHRRTEHTLHRKLLFPRRFGGADEDYGVRPLERDGRTSDRRSAGRIARDFEHGDRAS